jgi:putative transcriptional regulator
MDENQEVFNSIIAGLNQAVEYEKGKLQQIKRTVVTISPLPHYEGQRIRQIRTDLKLSQRTFANVLGVSKKTVEAWEAGKNVPHGPAQRILDLLVTEENFLEKHNILCIT